MNISAAGTNYSSAYPSLSGPIQHAPLSDDLLKQKGLDRTRLATEVAQISAGNIELEVSALNKSIKTYNRLTDDFIKKYLEESEKQYGEEYRLRYGDAWVKAWAERHERTMLREREDAQRYIESTDQYLRMQYNVSGSIYEYDARTDTYSQGVFKASVDLGDSAVRFDSKKGAEISIMGRLFTANFTRDYTPQPENLDYLISQLVDLRA